MTFGAIKDKLAALLGKANETTGGSDTNLTDAVTRLREGFGKGAVTEGLYATGNGTYTPPEGVDGFDQVEVNVYPPPVNSGRLVVSENGEYLPQSYGYEYFDSVYVEPQYMASPANPEDVRSGREYIDSCGTVQIGSMPENTADSVTIHTDSTRSFTVSFQAGYYPEDVSVSGQTGYTGGNASMLMLNAALAVGEQVFVDFPGTYALTQCLLLWYMIFREFVGTGVYYMPSSVMLALDSPVIVNGAFFAERVDDGGTNTILYRGSDVSGAYRLELTIEGSPTGDKLLGISLTNNGDEVAAADGLGAGIYFTLPFLD